MAFVAPNSSSDAKGFTGEIIIIIIIISSLSLHFSHLGEHIFTNYQERFQKSIELFS